MYEFKQLEIHVASVIYLIPVAYQLKSSKTLK